MMIRSGVVRATLWWGLMLVILLGGAAWIRAGEAGQPFFDREALILANAWRGHWLDEAFLGLTWLGSLWILLPLVLAAAALLWRKGRWVEACFFVVALLGASLLAHQVKDLALRSRPDLFPALTLVGSEFSFPSAHAVQVTAVAAAAWLVAARLAPRHRRWLLPALLLIVVLVDLSRLYLQVHYPSDVVAGTVAAACWVGGLGALMLPQDAAADA